LLHVFGGLIKVLHFHIGHSSKVPSLDSLGVDLNSQGALDHCVFVVPGKIKNHREVLETSNFELFDLLVVELAGVQVS